MEEQFVLLFVLVVVALFVFALFELVKTIHTDQEKYSFQLPQEKINNEPVTAEERFRDFRQKHPKLKDKTTISRLKTFIKQQYTLHKIIRELYRLYLLDCDAVGKPPLSFRKWKFAYGL